MITVLFSTIFILGSLLLSSATTTINMRALILTTEKHIKDGNIVKEIFQGYGIPFDILAFNEKNIPKSNLTLTSSSGDPLYNLIVVDGGNLSYENSSHSWNSYLTSSQWAYLEEYEAKYNVRRVSIDSEVKASKYIELCDPNKRGTTVANQKLIPADNDITKKIFSDTRVKFTAPLDINNIYHGRIKIIDEKNVKPFLYYEEKGKKGAVGATIINYPNGREQMNFYFGFGSWSQSSVILCHLWLVWGTRNIFNGFRRVYFTAHIDDVFLSTGTVDIKENLEINKKGISYRTSTKDYDGIIKFQNSITKKMPSGSKFKVELAFNGNGILSKADSKVALSVDPEPYVDIEYVKKPGTGDKRWPTENYKLDISTSALKKDPLFAYFRNHQSKQKEFFWSSHTFTHENLDDASKSDVDNEIRVNIEMAKKLGVHDKEWWSGHSIITPQISGLHNKDALDVFKKYGINSATGDLSRSAITNHENPYLPFFTTKKSSNLEGFPIIPRSPTEVYFMCTTKEENTWMYNRIYKSTLGKESTWNDIIEREGKRTLLLLTKLRHEAHQFHQSNLRNEDTGASLLEEWVTPIVNTYNKYVEWPLISIKLDSIAEEFVKRADLESCGQVVKLIIDNNKVTGVSVSATKGKCIVPVTVPVTVRKSSLPSGAKLEQVGKDPLTVWVPVKKGETKTIKFRHGVDWKINNSSKPANPKATTTIPTTIPTPIKHSPKICDQYKKDTLNYIKCVLNVNNN